MNSTTGVVMWKVNSGIELINDFKFYTSTSESYGVVVGSN